MNKEIVEQQLAKFMRPHECAIVVDTNTGTKYNLCDCMEIFQ